MVNSCLSITTLYSMMRPKQNQDGSINYNTHIAPRAVKCGNNGIQPDLL